MTENNRFDVMIIGTGHAASRLAHDLAKAGRRVALVEEKHFGGSCVGGLRLIQFVIENVNRDLAAEGG